MNRLPFSGNHGDQTDWEFIMDGVPRKRCMILCLSTRVTRVTICGVCDVLPFCFPGVEPVCCLSR
jgi:hypothetical protein